MLEFVLLEMTKGAAKVAETDPHGLTLSLISIVTVFTALLVLYFVYSLIGKAAQKGTSGGEKPGKKASGRRRKGKAGPDSEVAAAIALALEAESGHETEAAIATALHLYLSGSVHDIEPGIITIKPAPSAWAGKSITFRKNPKA